MVQMCWAIFLLLVSSCTNNVSADWINLTGAETAPNIAEVYILDNRIKLVLEVYIGDLEVFSDLIPDDWVKDDATPHLALEQRLKHFSEQGIQIIDGQGQQLQARIDIVEPRVRVDRKSPFAGMINPFNRQQVPGAPADKRVLYAEISYPYKGRPSELTFIPPQDTEGRSRVSIGFIAYHKSVPIIDFRYLGAPAKLTLDWDDPWYSKFENPNLKRHHKSALMSFLYVEPYEVRHEILTRITDLKEWMDLGLRSDTYIEVDELEPLKQRIGEFLLTRNPVLIDGKVLKPILDRSNYIKVALSGLQLVETPERMEISTAIIGVIITYLTDGLPQEVTVDWNMFTDQVQKVPATATDPAGPLPTYLTPDDNIHRWTNYLNNYRLPTVQTVQVAGSMGDIRIPWLTLVCAVLLLLVIGMIFRRIGKGGSMLMLLIGGLLLIITGIATYPLVGLTVKRPASLAGEMSTEQAQELLQVLLKNVYRAFDFRNEEDVYDKLAVSVSGDLLSDIYLQNRRAFSIQKAGGAQASIQTVEIDTAVAERLDDRPLAYAIKGSWAAEGSVGHWGHIHTRRNHYDAIVTVEAVDGAWKITDLEVLEEKRVEPGIGSASASKPSQSSGAL
jgi:hypothetical protein